MISEIINKRRRVIPKIREICRDGLHGFGVPISKNGYSIRSLKNRYRDQRVFVLGNGPSLSIQDLTLLKDEITFASNKVYLAFDQTEWRPNYYFVFDKLVALNNAAVIRELPLTKLFSNEVRPWLGSDPDAIWLHETYENGVWLDQERDGVEISGGHFSTNALLRVSSGWTVIYAQLQLAHYMGFREIVLLGLDFSFNVDTKKVETKEKGYEVALESRGERNHFHPDYRKPGEVWAIPRLDMQERAFRLAKAAFEESGRVVVNASRQSKLDVFPRTTLEAVLNSKTLTGNLT